MSDPYAPQNYVPQGYLPPADAYMRPMADGPDPNDPLVNPPHSGINGWFTRIGGIFQRSWKLLLAIFAITTLIPTIGVTVIVAIGVLVIGSEIITRMDVPGLGTSSQIDPDFLAIGIPAFVGIALAGLLVFIYLQSVGYAAATYAATKQAAGYQPRLGEALGYGFRRGVGLLGWQVLVGLLCAVGFLACIVPGIYFYAATALFGPIFLFERRSPIGRSFSIFNANIGRVLGRLALLLLATFIVNGVTSIFDQVGSVLAGNTGEMSVIIAGAVISSALGIIVELPLTMLTFAGVLLTYTEQRGYEGPVNAQTLAGEL